jgi:putative hemolysin
MKSSIPKVIPSPKRLIHSLPKFLLHRNHTWNLNRQKAYRRFMGKEQADVFFDRLKHARIEDFLLAYKHRAQLKHKIQEHQIQRIPSENSLLVLANHPTGIPDGLLILDTLLTIRSDIKLLIKEHTYPGDALKDYTLVFPNDTDHGASVAVKNVIEEASAWLSEGHCLVVFSNSEVALHRKLYRKNKESFWSPIARTLIEQHKGWILPWAIRGKNSPLFYHMSRVVPQIKRDLIPRESLKRRWRPIESVIGKPFKFSDEQSIIDLELKIRLMTKKPFPLALKTVLPQFKPTGFKTIADAIDPFLLKQEIAAIGLPITQKAHHEVYLCAPGQGKWLLEEIGRLRERTFRLVGEGTGKSKDLDAHDPYFYHLILWDSEASCIAGAYRLGMGPELLSKNEYTHILYEFYHRNTQTDALLGTSMIMGRAFVTPEYQSKPFPLFLLWNGIIEVIKSRKDIHYLIGQTSLPNNYHRYSKQLITSFLWKHFSEPEWGKLFVPFHPLRIFKNRLIEEWVARSHADDIKRLDKIIECVEPNGAKIPMLFRRYIEQKARCVAINVDPEFQNAIDLLMVTKVSDLLID